jgi:hypothetical protein
MPLFHSFTLHNLRPSNQHGYHCTTHYTCTHNTHTHTQLQTTKIEPKRPGESLRAFNARLKVETGQALKEEFKRNSATLARRKGHLADKSKKRKMQKAGLWEAHVAQQEQEARGETDKYVLTFVQFLYKLIESCRKVRSVCCDGVVCNTTLCIALYKRYCDAVYNSLSA